MKKKPAICTAVRRTWAMDCTTRVKQNKKGKGAYNRQRDRRDALYA